MASATNVPLGAIELPVLVPAGGLTHLWLGVQRVRASGHFKLTPGSFVLTESGVAVVIEGGTSAEFTIDVSMRSELLVADAVGLWPIVDRFELALSQPVRATIPSGQTAVVTGAKISSHSTARIDQHVGVDLGDTLALALTKLIARPGGPQREVRGPTDLIEEVTIAQATADISAGPEIHIAGHKLKLGGGTIEIADLVASQASQLLTARAKVSLVLAPGSRLIGNGSHVAVEHARVSLLAAVVHRDGTLFVGAVEESGEPTATFDIEGANVALADEAGTCALHPSTLTLRGLTFAEGQLSLAVEGSLALGPGRLDFGAGNISFAKGAVASVQLVTLKDAQDVAVEVRGVSLEKAAFAAVTDPGGRVDLRAAEMLVEGGARSSADAVEGGSVTIQTVDALLEVDDGRGHRIEARSRAPSQLIMEAKEPIALASKSRYLSGLRMSAQWEDTTLSLGPESVTLTDCGIEVGITSSDPLKFETNIHTADAHAGGLPASLGSSGFRLAFSEGQASGSASVHARVPLALLREALRRELPESLSYDLDGSDTSMTASALAVFMPSVAIARFAVEHSNLHVQATGRDTLELSDDGGALRISGTMQVAVALSAQVGGFPSVTVGRGTVDLPIDATVGLSTNAPAALGKLALILTPRLRASDHDNALVRRVAQQLVDAAADRVFRLPISGVIAAQLPAPATQGAKVHKASLKVSSEHVEAELSMDVATS